MTSDERLVQRQEPTMPLWAKLHSWLKGEREQVPDGSAVAKAIDYSPKHWTASTHHLGNGRVPLNNNHLEG
ncbi:hypothetical protein GmRootV35_59190 [Variovorax sp. V35]